MGLHAGPSEPKGSSSIHRPLAHAWTDGRSAVCALRVEAAGDCGELLSSRKRKVFSLQEAAEEANAKGLIGDFFGLNETTYSDLRKLWAQTRWRQSASSERLGHSILWAFHQALKRRLPKSRGGISKADAARAEALFQAAAVEYTRAEVLFQESPVESRMRRARRALLAAADSFEVAAEAAEDVGNMRLAVEGRRRAGLIRDVFEITSQPSRRRQRDRSSRGSARRAR